MSNFNSPNSSNRYFKYISLPLLFVAVIVFAVSYVAYDYKKDPNLNIDLDMTLEEDNPAEYMHIDSPEGEWEEYTTLDNVLIFSVPEDTKVNMNPNNIIINVGDTRTPDNLTINYTTDGSNPVMYSGTPAGELQKSNTVEFFDTQINKNVLILDEKINAIYYGEGIGEDNIVQVDNLKFIITVTPNINSETGITPLTEELVEKILVSIEYNN